MSNNREMVKMSSLIESISMGPFGSDVKVEYMVDSGVPFLDGSNLTSVRMNDDSLKFVTREKADSLKNALVHPYDIVITHRGTIGQISYVPDDLQYNEFLISQSQFRVTLDRNKVDPVYFAYYFHTQEGQKRLLSFANYVGVPALASATTNFKDLEFPLIPLSDQKKIAQMLLLFDDKVRNNNAICSNLEAMAKLLYDYWFVQFDFPDENGKPYKSSGGKMVWNDELKREIPAGWEVTTIGSITRCRDAERIPVANKDRENMKGNIPYYGATGIMGYVNRAIFSGDFVLMAEDGSVMDGEGHPIIQRVSGDVWINNHAHVLEPIKGYSCRLLMMVLKDIPVVKIKTGSIQMKINQENMNAYKIVDIPDSLIQVINERLNVIDEKLLELEAESQQLASLRDFLLPMLMNGQVKVGDHVS